MIDFLDCYDWLWKPGIRKREALEHLAMVVVQRPDGWDREAQRDVPKMTAEACFLCGTVDRWLVWHHAVLVKNGGSRNPWNLVALCQPCHKSIHPWLKERMSVARGWTAIGEVGPPREPQRPRKQVTHDDGNSRV